MVVPITVLLAFQLVGEVLARAFALPLPGPVLGMVGLLTAFALFPWLMATVRPVATFLLAHLSLLFVPAGVGVVAHLDRFGTDGVALGLTIVGSTVLTLLVAVGVFIAVARWTDPKTERPRDD